MSGGISFILQGPYSVSHLSMVKTLKKFGKVVLSCYVSDFNSIVDPSIYDSIVLNETIDCEKVGIYNYRNIYHQVRTTSRALSMIETEYSVKFRSDSHYSGIEYIVDSIKQNIDKMSIVPMGINPHWPYQFSDHVIGSATSNLKQMYLVAENNILTRDFVYDGIDTRLCAEVLLFTSWLKSKNIKGITKLFDYYVTGDPKIDERMKHTDGKISVNVYANYHSVVKDNINILDISKLEPFYIKSNTLNVVHTKSSDFPINDLNEYRQRFDQYHGTDFTYI